MNNSVFLENNLSQFIIRYNESQAQKISKIKPKPISVSSEISLPSHNKRKFRLNSTEICSLQKNQRKSAVSHNLHTSLDEKKQERDYSRVPIEYMQERDTGNPADRVRGRVVYRGYAPKNTYFYFKKIKELRFAQLTGQGDREYRGEDICFNSKFQSGNLSAAVRVASREYWLYMRQDTNTHGLRQWFFFEVRSRKAIKIRMRIYRYTKKNSLYKLGMKPYVRTIDSDWRQNGQKIVYQYDPSQKCYYLQFQYHFEEHKQVYFASLPPYTYSMMNSYLETLATNSRVAVKRQGLSLGGLDIFSVKISSLPKKHEEQHFTLKATKEHQQLRTIQHSKVKKHEKEAVVVLARTHPGQTVSNWSLQSFIDRVLQKDQLTEHYNFYILPMINPDGVFLGNHRTGVLGQDLNRNFSYYDLQYFPEIQIVQNLVSQILKKQKIAFLFDLHGHSAKKNIFAFGQQCEIGTNRYLFSRIIPKIIADSIDSFRLDHCLFKASKEKTNTARVYFSKKYHINAITFEQSYGLLESGCIGISNWRNFGTAMADSLLTYFDLAKQKKDEIIFYYLSDLMDAQKQQAIKKIQQKQKRIRQKQKQKQKEAEEQKKRLIFSKTDQAEGLSTKISKIFEKQTKKSEILQENRNSTQIEQEKQEKQNQSFSSGDEELEMRQNELQLIKKQIVRLGVINKEIVKRELYSMAQKKMELVYQYADYPNRLHHKNSAIVQRIFKFKSKQKARQSEMLYSISQREKNNKIELPNIWK